MPSQNYLFPEDEPPTQHSLFDAPADADAADAPPPPPRRRLTTEEIDRVRDVPGFPIATDEAIIALSDPPHYTACPNPFLAEIVAGWRNERTALRATLGLPDDEADAAAYQREPFAADVSEGKNDPIYNAHSYHTKVPHKAIMRYILHYTDPGDLVFDGFCGTGMTGVAAQLCGDRAAVEALGYIVDDAGLIYDPGANGVDGAEAPTTSPTPSLVGGALAPSSNGAEAPTTSAPRKPFSRLGARKAVLNDLSPAATFIAYNYNTPVDAAAFEAEAKRILREVEAECGWMYATTHTDGRKGRINYTVWSDMFICPNCTIEIVLWDEIVDLEKSLVSNDFPCPSCKMTLSRRIIERSFEDLYDQDLQYVVKSTRRKPVLVNYSIDGRRFEKTPSGKDIDLLQKIENFQANHWRPIERMPEGDESRRNDDTGITHVHQFFTRRNIIALSAIYNHIQSGNEKTRLIFGLTSILDRMSYRNRYMPQHRNNRNREVVGPLSGTLYVPFFSLEINPIDYIKSKLRPLNIKIPSASSIISTHSTTNYWKIPNSADYIFTDPPFGSNLMYSDLNFIMEAWLQVMTSNTSEAVVSNSQQKRLDTYQQIIEKCFRQYYEALKPGHWMTVEFHNSQNSVWNSIQEAIIRAGFVIADIRTLDKQKGTTKQLSLANTVKQDLVISAYKPRAGFERSFAAVKGTEDGAWAFVREHLAAVPVFVAPRGKAEIIAERMPYLLFDRMVAFHLQRGATVPLSAAQFYAGLKQRCPERDGMHFLETQAAEYDQRRAAVGAVEQFTFYVSDEKSSLQWLRQLLSAEGPQSYQQIQPRFLQELQQNRNELLPELRDLLQASFLQDAQGRWQVPDPANELHLEQLRQKELLREYDSYAQSRGKLKSVRSEAVRAGFEAAYKRGDYAAILAVAPRLPEAVLREDPTVLTYYDLAQMEVEE